MRHDWRRAVMTVSPYLMGVLVVLGYKLGGRFYWLVAGAGLLAIAYGCIWLYERLLRTATGQLRDRRAPTNRRIVFDSIFCGVMAMVALGFPDGLRKLLLDLGFLAAAGIAGLIGTRSGRRQGRLRSGK
jgi:hypothetical protein